MKKKPMKAVTMIQIGLGGALLVFLILLLVWYIDGLNSFKPETGTYQYEMGIKFDYGKDAVYRNKDGVISVEGENSSNDNVTAPILYEDDSARVTLTKDMLLMNPRNGTELSRINYFSTITETSGRSTITKDDKSAQSFGGFLYDGKDTYIFLEDVNLVVGGRNVVLGPLSYVIVNYQQYVEYHNSLDNEHNVIYVSDIDAHAMTDDYRINLSKDAINVGEGESLLYNAIDTIAVLDME